MAQFAPSEGSTRYIRMHVDRRDEFANADSFAWKTTNLSNPGTLDLPMSDANNPFLSQAVYESDSDAWRPDTILRTKKLPRGMRYAVDWRFIGGAIPAENGIFKAGSIRRWVRPVQMSQVERTSTLAAHTQELSLSRCAQLGELSRHSSLGGVPYLPISRADPRFERASTHLSQLAKDCFLRAGRTVLNRDSPLQTWTEIKIDPETGEVLNKDYALSTAGHRAQRDLRDPQSSVEPTAKSKWPYNEEGNNKDEENSSWTQQAMAVFIESETDPFLAPFVGPQHRFNLNRLTVRPLSCYDTPEWYNFGWPLQMDQESTRYLEGVKPLKLLAYRCAKWCSLPHSQPDREGYLPSSRFGSMVREIPRVAGNYLWSFSTNGSTAASPYSIHSGIFTCKNQGVFTTGGVAQASPAVFLAWIIDNYGPCVHSLSTEWIERGRSSLQENWRLSGGSIEELGQILYPELLMTGRNDLIDLAVRASLDRFTADNFARPRERMKQGGNEDTSRSALCVGYIFLPDAQAWVQDEATGQPVLRDDPTLVFIYMGSRFNAGSFGNMRGYDLIAVPLTHGFVGIDELRMGVYLWNQTGRVTKYFYDGSVFLDSSLPRIAGDTNELRGADPCDYRQTKACAASGKTLRYLATSLPPSQQTEQTEAQFVASPVFSPPPLSQRLNQDNGSYLPPSLTTEFYSHFRDTCSHMRGFPRRVLGYHNAGGQGVQSKLREASALTVSKCAEACDEIGESCTHFTFQAPSRTCVLGKGSYIPTQKTPVNEPTFIKFPFSPIKAGDPFTLGNHPQESNLSQWSLDRSEIEVDLEIAQLENKQTKNTESRK